MFRQILGFFLNSKKLSRRRRRRDRNISKIGVSSSPQSKTRVPALSPPPRKYRKVKSSSPQDKCYKNPSQNLTPLSRIAFPIFRYHHNTCIFFTFYNLCFLQGGLTRFELAGCKASKMAQRIKSRSCPESRGIFQSRSRIPYWDRF